MRDNSIIVKRRVAIVTNNVNCERHIQYYSRIEKYFAANGWVIAEDFNVEKVIICCCGFHDVMHEKVLRTIDQLKAIHFLENNIIIMGCQSVTHKLELETNLAVKLINFDREDLLDKIINAKIPFDKIIPTNIFRPYKGCKIDEKNEYFHIKIAQGCLRKCTFCVINKAKGYIKSTPREEIIRQFKKATARDKRRIYLMGEDTCAYGIDINTNIIELCRSLLDIDPDVEFNFGSMHIRWLQKYADGILALCKQGVVKELHVGLQHVNERLLKRMGRPIVFPELHQTIKTLKKECPHLFLEADILVGFPGETEEMFNELMEFFKQDKCFDNVRHFGYSDVKGAPSHKFKDKLSQAEIVSRWQRFDKILGERSSNYQSENANPADKAFQVTHENDYTFCKDTFKDKIEEKANDTGLVKAKSKIQQAEKSDFQF